MDFISNLIKRPISLVRSDSLSSTPTEKEQTTSRPTTPQQFHSSLLSFDRANSPEARQHHITSIMDTLNKRDDFRSIATVSATNRASPPITQSPSQTFSRSLQISTSSNGSSIGSNSATAANTIEELLLQINDNLNIGDLHAATQLSQHHLPNRPLSVCPSALTMALSSEFNAIASKSANLKGTSSLQPKESLALESAPVAMVPVANNFSSSTIIASEKNSGNIDPKTDLLDGQNLVSNKTDCVVEGPYKLGYAANDLSEIKTSEMTTQLNVNTEDGVKIKFEDGLIPTLTAAINEHEKYPQEKDSNSAPPSSYLQVNTESDTATSSDNETFAECQSYQMNAANKDFAFIANDYNFENSEIESYFSAANSRNTTLTNVGADPLSLTVNKIQTQNENEQDDLQSLLSAISGDDMLTQQNIHSLDVTYDEEPMDVDISFNESKENLGVEQSNLSTSRLKNTSNLSLGKVCIESVAHTIPSSTEIEYTQGNTSKHATDNTNNMENATASAADLDKIQFIYEAPLNSSVEIADSTSAITKNVHSKTDCISTETASEITADHTQTTIHTTSPTLNNLSNTSLIRVEECEIKKCILEDSKVLIESHDALNSTTDMSASTSSSKSTTASPNFPMKDKENSLKQFPRSPTAHAPKTMSYLEKSEYTERIETERKKSVVVEPQLTLSNSRKTSTVHGQPPGVANSDEKTLSIVNPIIYQTNTPNDDTSSTKVNDESKPKAEENGAAYGSMTSENDEFLKDSNFKNNMKNNIPFTIVAPVVTEDDNASSQNPENESNKRRTFNIPNLEEKEERKQKEMLDEKRRTFNISVPIGMPEHSNSKEINVPMDLDYTFSATNTDIHSYTKTSQTLRDSLTTTVSNSPPIQALQNRHGNMPSSSSSPPIQTLQNRNEAENGSTIAPHSVKPTTSNFNMGYDAFKVPMPPSPSPAAASPPMPIVQKRPSIHAYKNTEDVMEILSAKEQTKRDASDEKDIFTGNCTPSPMEELPSSICSFDNLDNGQTVDVDQQIFANEEFQSGNDLILNASDFDYLFTKGNNNAPIDRSSILLKFDPLLGVPVPVNQIKQQQPPKASQQILQQVLGSKINNLSPTVEEDEHSSSTSISSTGNNQSFIVEADNKCNSFGVNTTNDRSVNSNKNSSKTSIENQQVKGQQHNHQGATLKKYASMSVDVIKDMNIDNDCNKSFENSNTQLDEKQINYKMDELEKKIKNEVLKTEDIEKKLKESEQREEALIKRITDKDKTITKMTGVIEAYEKAIAELIAEKEQLIQNYEKQLAEVKTDRDSNYQHLTSLETTFADLHVKYGKSKEMTMQLKTNEEALVTEKRQILENLRLQEQRYDKMKNHAMQQLEIANKKLESLNKEHNIETTKLKALLKKEEISRASINEQLQQKSRENAELVKICDELINGQGS